MLVVTLRRELAMQEALRDLRLSELFASAFPNEPDGQEAAQAIDNPGADPRLVALVAEWQEARRMDGETDDEDGGDAEPSLGAPDGHESQIVWLRGTTSDDELTS